MKRLWKYFGLYVSTFALIQHDNKTIQSHQCYSHLSFIRILQLYPILQTIWMEHFVRLASFLKHFSLLRTIIQLKSFEFFSVRLVMKYVDNNFIMFLSTNQDNYVRGF